MALTSHPTEQGSEQASSSEAPTQRALGPHLTLLREADEQNATNADGSNVELDGETRMMGELSLSAFVRARYDDTEREEREEREELENKVNKSLDLSRTEVTLGEPRNDEGQERSGENTEYSDRTRPETSLNSPVAKDTRTADRWVKYFSVLSKDLHSISAALGRAEKAIPCLEHGSANVLLPTITSIGLIYHYIGLDKESGGYAVVKSNHLDGDRAMLEAEVDQQDTYHPLPKKAEIFAATHWGRADWDDPRVLPSTESIEQNKSLAGGKPLYG